MSGLLTVSSTPKSKSCFGYQKRKVFVSIASVAVAAFVLLMHFNTSTTSGDDLRAVNNALVRIENKLDKVVAATKKPVRAKRREGRKKTRVKATAPIAEPVDVVIVASLASDAGLADANVAARVTRDRDNGELKYTLRALAKNAPWVRRIYVLVNGVHKLPSFVAEPQKTTMVDRCALLPDGACPTRNGFTAMSVVHKIPGLSEQVLYSDDDNLLAQPADVDDFFKDGTPYCFVPGGGPTFDRLYTDEDAVTTVRGVGRLPERVRNNYHLFHPLSKSALEKMERKYRKWLSFMRTHSEGRFCSQHRYGTQACEDANSMEEDMGPIWDWWLLHTDSCIKGEHVSHRTKKGQMSGSSLGSGTWDQANTENPYTVEKLRADFGTEGKFIVNMNDDLPMDRAEEKKYGTTYELALQAQNQVLDEQFPPLL